MNWFGIIGFVCVQIFHVPQLYKLYKRYKTLGSRLDDISATAYSMLFIGLLSYAIYGFGTGAPAFYVAGSVIGAVQVGATLYMLWTART